MKGGNRKKVKEIYQRDGGKNRKQMQENSRKKGFKGIIKWGT